MSQIVRLTKPIVRQAERHLRQSCPVMASLIEKLGPCRLVDRRFPPFRILARSIVCQLISAKAAEAVEGRIIALVPNYTPAEFLAVSLEDLRATGLSWAKAGYIIELAKRVSDGRLDLKAIATASEAEAVATLKAVPGIGQWTAEMFLVFGLRWPDVLSLGDVGLKRAARLLFGEKADLEAVARPWRPYRSVASWYLWRSLG
ncbi:MAG: DNA-3-methyladenine glycosylase 2 family protein [Deltaproteobacteria bacterium]|nr:DNA-3-methyladenine glycosylase 2 family protein [Deltaproteobacteria bacterium]